METRKYVKKQKRLQKKDAWMSHKLDTQLHIYYVPCPNKTVAKKIAINLLKQNLIVCANILPDVLSLYVWQGKQSQSKEVILILKSFYKHSYLSTGVEKLHPYDTPCILELKSQEVNKSYLKWARA